MWLFTNSARALRYWSCVAVSQLGSSIAAPGCRKYFSDAARAMATPLILNKVPPFNTMDPQQTAQIEAATALAVAGWFAYKSATYALALAGAGYVVRMYV